MNLKDWDAHKTTTIITAFTLMLFFIIANVSSSMEETAWQYSAKRLSTQQVDAVNTYIENYERHLSPSYYTLDSLTTILTWVLILGVLYSAWTALDIPERYQKEPKTEEPKNGGE